jgi:hypothetical protein
MLLISRQPGVYSKEYTQWETIWKAGSAIENQQRASPQATNTVMALGDEKGNYSRFSSDPVSSVWFTRLKEGYMRRMGQDHRPIKALSTQLIVEVLIKAEARIFNAPSVDDGNRWVVFGTYAVFCM